jgi:hypothetical protein
MKIDAERKLLILSSLFFATQAYAQPPPPPALDGDPPLVSIDENIFILLGVAILFGIYIVYRNNIKTKNPI